jgi:FtsP/CotA-like multicopper oxidase with cupredoxin domain
MGIAGVATAAGLPPARAQSPRPLPGVGPGRAVEKTLRVARQELNPDGFKIRGIAVNGSMPGPEIRVREGDWLRLLVQNALDVPTSIHWHGLLLPATMDGVPGVSQVPIAPGAPFLYEYPLRQSGTYWYHSHFGTQEQSGLGGPFIIEAKNDPLAADREYVIYLQDWLHSDPDQVVPELRKRAPKKPAPAAPPPGGQPPKMAIDGADVQYPSFLLNGRPPADPWVGAVKRGERVRLRVINAGGSTTFRFRIDDHPFQVTHIDGYPVRPVTADNLWIATAERYDLLVTVRDAGSFGLRAAPLGSPGQALGVLRTSDSSASVQPGVPKEWGTRLLAYSQLAAPQETTLPTGPVRQFALTLGGEMAAYRWSINGQYYPKADPLLIKQGERVQVTIANPTMMVHPMHLHGHFFRVLGLGGDERFAPLKDTIGVWPKQTVRLEFLADNPGKWFFHCHNLYHLETGMAREWHYQL